MFGTFIALFLRFLPLLRILSLVSVIIGYMYFIYHKGEVSEQSKQQKIELNTLKIRDKVDNKNMTATDKDLDKRLEKWMRD